MTSALKSNIHARKTDSSRPLKIYCLGPGIGESIVLRLPCGGWGVVDCYNTEYGGTLDFLRQNKVERLKFFCLTHPHEDHYRGAHKLFDYYAGKVERIWRFPGFTTNDFIKLGVATRVRGKFLGERAAESMADDYTLLLNRLHKEGDRLDDQDDRQVIGPLQLLNESNYDVEALGPGTKCIRHFQERFAKIMIKTGPMLLNEEGGELINSMSIVLAITFGTATVFLLGDAQGPSAAVDPIKRRSHTLVKVAHHGSWNGLGAEVLSLESADRPCVDHGIVTPYSRSGLPTPEMLQTYTKACTKLVYTCPDREARPRKPVPGLSNARVPNKKISWIGIEVFEDGAVKQFQ
jgi:hypothetical protein